LLHAALVGFVEAAAIHKLNLRAKRAANAPLVVRALLATAAAATLLGLGIVVAFAQIAAYAFQTIALLGSILPSL
jgi:hypothetical protein